MSKEHPTPWKLDLNNADEPIKDANGERVLATDDGFLGPDDDTIREIVDAANERAKFEEARMKFPDFRPVIIAAGQRDAAIAERDRLRDIVRRLLPLAETTVENIRTLGTSRFPFEDQIKADRLRGDIQREVSNADHLLREARAAIGEDAP